MVTDQQMETLDGRKEARKFAKSCLDFRRFFRRLAPLMSLEKEGYSPFFLKHPKNVENDIVEYWPENFMLGEIDFSLTH